MIEAMSVKLDENLGIAHVELLRQSGYEADRVYDEGLSGARDEEVWERVCDEGRFLITLDLDFSDVRQYPVGSHPGILLLRPRSRSREAVIGVLRRIIEEQPLQGLRGCLTIADESHTRTRRPLDEPPSEDEHAPDNS